MTVMPTEAGGERTRQRGQGLAEYALILALILVLAVVALALLGNQISGLLSSIAETV
jgi:Flp pilus assembly pilin Flp